MKKQRLYTLKSPYRDDFKIDGYIFGEGKSTVAVVGAIRGDEIQQQYSCASLVKVLKELEKQGALVSGHKIMVVPSLNPSSMNIGKRFWSMDNTDINRMFPGYDKGETTQRIASAVFESVKDFEYGIQMASHYIPGEFIPHVRMLNTGYQCEQEATYFGLPYVYIRDVRPYDTTLLNYNWQIWGTKAFSIYTGCTDSLNKKSINDAVEAMLRFLVNIGLITSCVRPGYLSQKITQNEMTTIKSKTSGLIILKRKAQDSVNKGDLLGKIVDPYDASIRENINAPVSGVIFFNHEKPLVREGAKLFEIVEGVSEETVNDQDS